MEINEEEILNKEDWRLQAVTTLTDDWISPNNILHKKGALVSLTARVSYSHNEILSLLIPSIPALFLDVSNRSWVKSQKYLQNPKSFVSSLRKGVAKVLFPSKVSDLFNCLEDRMLSIVFAYSALEAFANEQVPDDYLYTRKRKDKRCTETFTKLEIERSISLDEKLSEILPNILNIETPKDKGIWNRYLILKNLRDRIIHFKSDDRMSVDIDIDNLWKELVNKKYSNFSLDARDIINYYFSNIEEKPRWLKIFSK